MSDTQKQEIRKRAISELKKLAWDIDTDFEVTANLPIAEIDEELRGMGISPERLEALSLEQILAQPSRPKTPAYAYISNELLTDERVSSDAKLMILKMRHLCRQQRYPEILELTREITHLAPDYWRGWINHSGAQVLLGNLHDGELILDRIFRDHSGDHKAVGAVFHGRGNVKEIRCRLNPSAAELIEITKLYEESLKFDPSRTNTRACLVINLVLSGQVAKSRQLIEESSQYEGFFDEMSHELRERGEREYAAKMYRVLPAFPMWFRNLMNGSGPVNGGRLDTAAVA
jgi:hypothetical protein